MKSDPVPHGSLSPSVRWHLTHCPVLGTQGLFYHWTVSSRYSAVVGSVSPAISNPESNLVSNSWKQCDIGHVTKVLCASIGSSVK